MNKAIASVNGKITPLQEASVPLLDRGFLYGDSVFETLVAFHDTVLDLNAHLGRLRFSAEQIGITIDWSDEKLEANLTDVVAKIDADKKSVRLIVTRGLGMGMVADADAKPNYILIGVPAAIEAQSVFTDGVKLKSKRHVHQERGATAKTSNYLDSIVAIQQARKESFDDVLWVNSAGEITESSIANVFFLGRDGDLLEVATPHPSSGLLVGITRTKLIHLLNSAKIPVTERVIYADEIPRFDEAFLCSTVRGLIPISRIDQHRLHTTREASAFKHFQRLYLASVTRDLGYRVDWNTGEALDAVAKPEVPTKH